MVSVRSKQTTVGVFVLVALAGSAFGDPQGPLSYTFDGNVLRDGNGQVIAGNDPFAPRNGTPAIVQNDRATIGLKMHSTNGSRFINSDTDSLVRRGLDNWTSIGDNQNGNDEIEAMWDESVGQDTNTIAVFWRSTGGDEFLPPGVVVDGALAESLEWRFGASDQATFRPAIDASTIRIVSAVMAFSTNGGASYSDAVSFGSLLSNPWNGKDTRITVPVAGLSYNSLLAVYEYEFEEIPAPGTALVLGVAGLAATRRRRA